MIRVRLETMKAPSKTVVVMINLAFLAIFLIIYVVFVVQPDSLYVQNTAFLSRCLFRDCNFKKAEKSSPVLQENTLTAQQVPAFLEELLKNARVGLVNMKEVKQWKYTNEVKFDHASPNMIWEHLFPDKIDEEEENKGPSCPELPMPDFSETGEMDAVAARIPCRWPKEGWRRDVFRLQVHLIVANLAVRRVVRNSRGKVRLVFLSPCRPMIEIFRCEDIVKREGEWWLYEIKIKRLEEKVAMPVGSCNLALPLWGEGINEEYNISLMNSTLNPSRREAYATVLHSSDAYLCGAISLAQSIKKTGSTRDLLLLHDKSIPPEKLQVLRKAGWTLRLIERIRNPYAKKYTYNEYNYSKLRLWQLTDYSKVVFFDSDIVVLKNLDLLFHFPQMTASGNDGVIFNSGIMVIEPSNCTFKTLMNHRKDIISYNGGDQGFLNEIFVWWHRLPQRANFLKWANTTKLASVKDSIYDMDPPMVYAIHYLGLKPWRCYRDYDCNWNIEDQWIFASDAAHRRWWRLYDGMDPVLQKYCGLTERRKIELGWDRQKAREAEFPNEHWKRNITDKRQNH